MQIEILVGAFQKSYDFDVPENKKIVDACGEIVKALGNEEQIVDGTQEYHLYSKKYKKILCGKNTFSQEGILYGDRLYLI